MILAKTLTIQHTITPPSRNSTSIKRSSEARKRLRTLLMIRASTMSSLARRLMVTGITSLAVRKSLRRLKVDPIATTRATTRLTITQLRARSQMTRSPEAPIQWTLRMMAKLSDDLHTLLLIAFIAIIIII
jgi:hypothetical protein